MFFQQKATLYFTYKFTKNIYYAIAMV